MTDRAPTGAGPGTARPLRIACVHGQGREAPPAGMDWIRFWRMSEALARRGDEVDAIPTGQGLWQARLNRLGSALRAHGVRLVAMGPGDVARLDATAVLHVGRGDLDAFGDWQRHTHAEYMVAHHSWDARAALYAPVFAGARAIAGAPRGPAGAAQEQETACPTA